MLFLLYYSYSRISSECINHNVRLLELFAFRKHTDAHTHFTCFLFSAIIIYCCCFWRTHTPNFTATLPAETLSVFGSMSTNVCIFINYKITYNKNFFLFLFGTFYLFTARAACRQLAQTFELHSIHRRGTRNDNMTIPTNRRRCWRTKSTKTAAQIGCEWQKMSTVLCEWHRVSVTTHTRVATCSIIESSRNKLVCLLLLITLE